MRKMVLISVALIPLLTMLSACNPDTSPDTKSASVASQDVHSGSDVHRDDDGDNAETDSDVVRLSDADAVKAGIVIGEASLRALDQSISLPAEIRFDADRVANLSPKVSGIVSKLYAGEGDVVKRGQTLALISSRELASLKAAWLNAQTGEALAEQKLAREEKLFADQITAEADLQAARANFEALKAASDAAENELHAAGVSDEALSRVAAADDGDNANSYLTAPISGMVVRRNVTLGETVSAGDASARTLFTIVDDSEVWADIAVYKQDISRVRKGADVTLKSSDGDILARSNVAFILPVIDETSRTATARVVIANPEGQLRPGQFVTAEINVGESTSVIQVPSSAVQTVEGQLSVFVPVDGGFAPIPVSIGVTSIDFTEVRSGLSVGERYVTDGAFTLKAQLEKTAFGDDHGH